MNLYLLLWLNLIATGINMVMVIFLTVCVFRHENGEAASQ